MVGVPRRECRLRSERQKRSLFASCPHHAEIGARVLFDRPHDDQAAGGNVVMSMSASAIRMNTSVSIRSGRSITGASIPRLARSIATISIACGKPFGGSINKCSPALGAGVAANAECTGSIHPGSCGASEGGGGGVYVRNTRSRILEGEATDFGGRRRRKLAAEKVTNFEWLARVAARVEPLEGDGLRRCAGSQKGGRGFSGSRFSTTVTMRSRGWSGWSWRGSEDARTNPRRIGGAGGSSLSDGRREW